MKRSGITEIIEMKYIKQGKFKMSDLIEIKAGAVT
jgi:hypothetical protein